MNVKIENMLTTLTVDDDQVELQNEDKNTLVCFIGSGNYRIEEKMSYMVELRLFILDDYLVEELNDAVRSEIQRIGKGFKHKIVGRLENNMLHSCGFIFVDDAFESDYSYLEGKMISIDVERIDAHFV